MVYKFVVVPTQLLYSSEQAISQLLDASVVSSCVLEITLVDSVRRHMVDMDAEEREEWEDMLRTYGLPRPIKECLESRYGRHVGQTDKPLFTTSQLSEHKLKFAMDALDAAMQNMGMTFQPIVEYFDEFRSS